MTNYTQVALPYHASNYYPDGPSIDLLALADDGSCYANMEVRACACCIGSAHDGDNPKGTLRWDSTDTCHVLDIIYMDMLEALGYAIVGTRIYDDGEYELYNIRRTN